MDCRGHPILGGGGEEAEAKNPLGYSNAIWNVVEPVRGGGLMGAVGYVAIEVLVDTTEKVELGLKMGDVWHYEGRRRTG